MTEIYELNIRLPTGEHEEQDTEPMTIGTAKQIIQYLLKGELRDFKLVKRKGR